MTSSNGRAIALHAIGNGIDARVIHIFLLVFLHFLDISHSFIFLIHLSLQIHHNDPISILCSFPSIHLRNSARQSKNLYFYFHCILQYLFMDFKHQNKISVHFNSQVKLPCGYESGNKKNADIIDQLNMALEQWRTSTIHDRDEQVFKIVTSLHQQLNSLDYSTVLETDLQRLCANVDEVVISVRSSLSSPSATMKMLPEHQDILSLSLVDLELQILLRSKQKQLYV